MPAGGGKRRPFLEPPGWPLVLLSGLVGVCAFQVTWAEARTLGLLGLGVAIGSLGVLGIVLSCSHRQEHWGPLLAEPALYFFGGMCFYFGFVPIVLAVAEITRPSDWLLRIENVFYGDYILRIGILCAAGIICFGIGYALGPFPDFLRRLVRSGPGKMNRRRLQAATVVAAVAGVGSLVLYVDSIGWAFLSSNWGLRAAWVTLSGSTGAGKYFYIAHLLLIVPFLVYCYSRSVFPWAAAAFVVFLCFSLLGGRGRALVPLLLLALAECIRRRVAPMRFGMVVGVLAVIAAFAGYVRGEVGLLFAVSHPLETIADHRFSVTEMVSYDFNRLRVLAFLLHRFEDGTLDLLYGETYLAVLTPVMSDIFPTWSYASPGSHLARMVNEGRGVVTWGPTPTLFGELLLNFHYLGIVLGFLVHGALARALQRVGMLLEMRSRPVLVVYVLALYTLVVTTFNGGYSAAALDVGIIVAPLILVLRWAKA